MTLHKRISFSLIELLVVVTVIAILVALMAGSVYQARRKSKLAICSNNIRQLLSGLMLYAADNGDAYPGRTVWNPNMVQWGTGYGTDLRCTLYFGLASRRNFL